jgi:hypothetical protein
MGTTSGMVRSRNAADTGRVVSSSSATGTTGSESGGVDAAGFGSVVNRIVAGRWSGGTANVMGLASGQRPASGTRDREC